MNILDNKLTHDILTVDLKFMVVNLFIKLGFIDRALELVYKILLSHSIMKVFNDDQRLMFKCYYIKGKIMM